MAVLWGSGCNLGLERKGLVGCSTSVFVSQLITEHSLRKHCGDSLCPHLEETKPKETSYGKNNKPHTRKYFLLKKFVFAS